MKHCKGRTILVVLNNFWHWNYRIGAIHKVRHAILDNF